jgi:hypothetical protein
MTPLRLNIKPIYVRSKEESGKDLNHAEEYLVDRYIKWILPEKKIFDIKFIPKATEN